MKIKKEDIDYIKSLTIGILLSIVLQVFFIKWYIINGSSMEPTLQNYEIVLADKYTKNYKNWDIIILDAPYQKEQKFFIKRIIGIPWDTIQIKEWKVFRNWKELHETYIQGLTLWENTYHVPKWKYLVFWDNREHSTDSRKCFIGYCEKDLSPYLDESRIEGKVLFIK